MSERERMGLPISTSGGDDGTSVWSACRAVGDTADVPLGMRLFRLGCDLARLIVQLRDNADRDAVAAGDPATDQPAQSGLRQLREILQASEPSLAASLFDPVIDRFGETLDNISAARPDLASDCDSLREHLLTFLDEPPGEVTSGLARSVGLSRRIPVDLS